MAWYDMFTPNSVGKHARRVQEQDAEKDDRMQSAQWLADQGTPEALLGLCRRFDLQLEHKMIQDRTEKEAVVELLVEKGPLGSAAARAHALQSHNFQHSLRAIERIEGSSAATALLLELLGGESVDQEFKPEKKRTLLLTMAERKDDRIVVAAAAFLVDYDEGVRHAAVEAIAAQEGDSGREPLETALKSRREESTRVRGRIGELFAARNWAIAPDDWLPAHLPNGYALHEGRLIASR